MIRSIFGFGGPYRPLNQKVVVDDEEGSIDLNAPIPQPLRITSRWRMTVIGRLIAALLLMLGVTALAIRFASSKKTIGTEGETDLSSTSGCPIRREWRTLSSMEKSNYISSVHCLLSQPSILAGQASQSLYEDFPFIHSRIGYQTHHAAPFLPWHRYFLKIYHSSLQQKCNHTGELVYWDWTLDWDHLHEAPVFGAEGGFGSDGVKDGEVTVGRTGRCVVDGPFSDVRPSYYDVRPYPHCLSRGFRDDDGNLGVMDGKDISPQSIEEVMKLDTYEAFVSAMENKIHDVIPFGVAGDFETFTAPYDPLFFLHHTQLDRLWWLWQQRDPERRLSDYSGHGQRHSIQMAKLTDKIDMSSLAPEMEINDIMDTANGLLCYRY